MKIGKKNLAAMAAAAVLTVGGTVGAASTVKQIDAYYNDVKVYIDGVQQKFTDVNGNVVEPFIYNGTTYLPIRGVAQTMGAYVEWEGETQSVKLYKETLPGTTYFLDVCKPYASDNYSEKTPENGQSMVMGGKEYTNGFSLIYKNAYAVFNLDGKYKSMSFLIGNRSNDDAEDHSVTVYLDGKAIETIEIGEHDLPKKVTIPLDNALQLKIVRNGGYEADTGFAEVTVE